MWGSGEGPRHFGLRPYSATPSCEAMPHNESRRAMSCATHRTSPYASPPRSGASTASSRREVDACAMRRHHLTPSRYAVATQWLRSGYAVATQWLRSGYAVATPHFASSPEL